MNPLPEGLAEAWEEFLADDPLNGLETYPRVFEHPMLFPLQRRRELAVMIRRALVLGATTIMDIGSDKGGGVYHWCKGVTTLKRMIVCEVRGTPYQESFELAFPHIEFLWLPYSSYAQGTIAEVYNWLKTRQFKIDAIFIDGDKATFNLDYQVYSSMLSEHSLAFFHDIQDLGPRAGFDATVNRTKLPFDLIVDTRETAQAIDNELHGLPPANPHEGWLRTWRGCSAGVGTIYHGNSIRVANQ